MFPFGSMLFAIGISMTRKKQQSIAVILNLDPRFVSLLRRRNLTLLRIFFNI